MFHPDILRHYLFRRMQCECNAIDACVDTASWFMVPAAALARFLIAMGIDAQRLQLLA